MSLKNSTLAFNPIPKVQITYEILKAFMKFDNNGDFDHIGISAIFGELKSSNIVSDSYRPFFEKLISTLENKGFLHHNKDLYWLSDNGYLIVLDWEADFASETDHIPIVDENAKIKIEINKPMKIFLSCGERDNEYPIANWLKEKLEEIDNVGVYWWHKDPTNPSSHRPVTTKLFNEIKNSNFFIGILHRRYRLPTGLYTTSVPCEDEFRWACFNKISRIGFRQKGINFEGMILDTMEIRVIDNSTQIIQCLQKSLNNLKKTE